MRFMEHKAAKARKIPINQWNEIDPVDRADMMAFDATEAKMEAWEQQEAERNRK